MIARLKGLLRDVQNEFVARSMRTSSASNSHPGIATPFGSSPMATNVIDLPIHRRMVVDCVPHEIGARGFVLPFSKNLEIDANDRALLEEAEQKFIELTTQLQLLGMLYNKKTKG